MSLPRSSFQLGGTLLLVLLLPGCNSSSEPKVEGLTGRYALLSIDGTALPRVTESSLDGSRIEIVSGRVEFRNATRLLDVVSFQRTSGAGVAEPVESDSGEFDYRLDGAALIVLRPQPYAPSSYADTALVEDNYLVMTRRLPSRKGYPNVGRHEVIYAKP